MVLNIDECIERARRRELLDASVLESICGRVRDILVEEGNVVSLQTPITVVGDVHGQFYDLLEIFRIGGECPSTSYLFLGDYVDRGHFSVETMTLLTCLKLRWPSRVTLLRGNHESRSITQNYGFYHEIIRKYGSDHVWRIFTDMFDYLTLSCVIDDTLFCVHGGLSPFIRCLDQIRALDRIQEVPHDGPIADFLWSDPEPDPNSPDAFSISQRGAGYNFGRKAVECFLETNGMQRILRAHQLCMEGYQVLFDQQLVTVWSCPNYCYRCGNLASVLELGPNGAAQFNVFKEAPEHDRDGPGSGSTTIVEYFL